MRPKWCELVINWILFETRALGLSAGKTRPNISDIRYQRILSGLPDFNRWAGRYKQTLRIVGKRGAETRNYSFNL